MGAGHEERDGETGESKQSADGFIRFKFSIDDEFSQDPSVDIKRFVAKVRDCLYLLLTTRTEGIFVSCDRTFAVSTAAR